MCANRGALVVATTVGVVETLKDQGYCRMNNTMKSMAQHAKNQIGSATQAKKLDFSYSSSSAISNKLRDEKRRKAEESLRTVMYLTTKEEEVGATWSTTPNKGRSSKHSKEKMILRRFMEKRSVEQLKYVECFNYDKYDHYAKECYSDKCIVREKETFSIATFSCSRIKNEFYKPCLDLDRGSKCWSGGGLEGPGHLQQHAKHNMRSLSQTKKLSSQSSAMASAKFKDEKAKLSEESLRTVMYLSCWGPN
ncbi:hypothetical protein V8G54_027622 [Vigna mungo]|uniref:Uncharacterized protein n=1 Tax=Vigna mungo TaxID=3915 RepID=A0AAQ3N1S1_VIGMU